MNEEATPTATDEFAQRRIIRFMSWRKIALVLSALALLASLASLATRGLAFGLDFTGGTAVEVGYEQPPDLEQVRQALQQAGFKNAVAVKFGKDTDVLVRLQNQEVAPATETAANAGVDELTTERTAKTANDKVGEKVLQVLRQIDDGDVQLRRIEFVGPQVGEELREKGGMALLIALGCIMVYIAFRFQFKFSVGAVAALAHDVLIVLGIFSIMQWDFDLTVLAALLAVIGYSLNDTIVVSDRIRENFRTLRRRDSQTLIDISLTQTLARTLVTSLTTLLVLFTLFIAGGEMINGFSKALIIGVMVGTYSSIYVASNILLSMNLSQDDLLVPEKEGVVFDDGMP